MASLESIYERLRWAAEELTALDQQICPWVETHADAMRTHGDFYAEANIVATRVDAPPTPADWGIVAGNIVHQARASLDNLVWQLVLLNGKEPIPGAKGNQFPIIDEEPKDFRHATRHDLRNVSDAHRARIETLQPYKYPDQVVVLTVLRELSNIDKHRFLQTAAFGIAPEAAVQPNVTPNQDVERIVEVASFTGIGLKDGAVIAWTEVVPCGPNPNVDMEATLGLEVAFEKWGQVVPTLSKALEQVARVLVAFASDFEPSPAGG